MSNHLTYTINLDYINTDTIELYIAALNLIVNTEKEKERKQQADFEQSRIKKSKKKLLTIDEIIKENEEENQEVEPEKQAENSSNEDFIGMDLSSMTKADLIKLCKDKDIKVLVKDTKNELLKKLA